MPCDDESISPVISLTAENKHTFARKVIFKPSGECIYTAPPGEEEAQRIPTWQTQDVRIGAASPGGRGGMEAKIQAALVAVRSGVQVVIANGLEPDALQGVVAGEDCGTWFPAAEGLNKRRQWLAFATTLLGP